MRHFCKYITLLIAFIIFFSSCKREDIKVQDELPPITQEGLNTFGCKINGEVLVPKDGEPIIFLGGA